MQGNYVEMKLGLPFWSGIFFFSLFWGGVHKKIMIGKITEKTVILSSPTAPHNKAHSDLFYFGRRNMLLLLFKLSHNLQPEKPPPPTVQQSSS